MPRRESSSPTPARTQRTAALPAYEPPILPLHTGAIETLSTTVPRLYNSPAEYVVSALHELTSSVGENMPQALLDSLENAARGVVDASAKLEGSRNVLAAIVAQERARGTWDMDDEDLEAEAVRVEEGVWGRFKKGFQKEMTAWEKMGLKERYAAHDGYKNFRHTLWDVQHPDRPVPSERHWFPEERGPGDEETDDEVEVAREVLNYNCPLTMKRFENPLESIKCHHNFEHDAIMQLIQQQPPGPDRVRRVGCPNVGCGAKIGKDDLKENKYLLEKMKRAEEREERERRRAELEEEEEEEDSEDEEAEAERMRATREEQVRVKKEKGKSRVQKGRGRVMAIDSDDDEE